jgi:hypothetical protein
MYQAFQSPVTPERKRELLELIEIGPWYRGIEAGLVGHAVAAAVWLAILLISWRDLKWNPKKALSVYLLGICFLLYVMYQIRRLVLIPLSAQRREQRAALGFRSAVMAAENVTVEKIEADEVVSVSHDEGTIYLFATGPKQCFWFEPPKQPSKDWPNSSFEIVRVPGWRDDLGPFCRGKKLQPRASLEFREVFGEDFDPETIPEDGVIEHSLDEFLAITRSRI